MLSSALKHGSIDHLAPHARQIKGDETLGVPPLSWHSDDAEATVASMIDVSLANLAHHIPEFQSARYDFKTGTFRNSKGELISDGMLDRWASTFSRVRKARARRNTLKRGILLNTLAHTGSGQRPGLLEQALRQPGKLVTGGTERTFYSLAKKTADVPPAKADPTPWPHEIAKVRDDVNAELQRSGLDSGAPTDAAMALIDKFNG